MEKGKIVVGVSGGVDSAVTAYLLKEQGYEVIGVTLNLWDSSNQDKALKDGKRVAEILGIEHIVMDYKEQFENVVIKNFSDCYLSGLTPNPCIMCNPNVKFNALLEKAKEVGAEHIATGHYARIDKYEKTNRYAITNSSTAKKDQTYALYRLKQEQLQAMILPIGEYEKDEVRKIALNIDSYFAEKKDSQDICFVPDGEYANFIENYTGKKGKEGSFVDTSGNILGKHKGLLNYTIGQRKGLGIAFGTPRYVQKLNSNTNEVVLCEDDELFSNELTITDVTCMALDKFESGMKVEAKIRYSHGRDWCVLDVLENGDIKCTFEKPQRAITAGQSVVIYDGEFILGGGLII